ncbi:MAG: hypothetical protein Hals2KO_38660 [Halioglobus sp.]
MPNNAAAKTEARQGRLQRPPGADGFRVDSFAAVLRRHGATMGCIALACLALPGALGLLQDTLHPLTQNPRRYLVAVLLLLIFFSVWSAVQWRRRQSADAGRQSLWILYLLFISIVEEVAFRLGLPALLSTQMERMPAHIISNLLFAALHYFTLRWRFGNCMATFLGGMGLAHLMGRGDLTLVILVHWLGTFINTPAPPPR